MKKRFVIPAHNFAFDLEDADENQRLSYLDILEFFKKSMPAEPLETSVNIFENEISNLRSAIKHSISIFEEQPLLVAFLTWLKHKYVRFCASKRANMLIEKNILNFMNDNGHLLKIKDIDEKFLTSLLESVRCRKELHILERELLVMLLQDFSIWIRASTGLLEFEIIDRDIAISSLKVLGHGEFMDLLINLEGKFQVIAKLLYYGLNITFEQVLSLNIQDINLDSNEIDFGAEKVCYSLHVLMDLKDLIGEKTAGRIFVGRQNNPLNPATVFRHFKEAALKSGLDPSFSPKTLLRMKRQ